VNMVIRVTGGDFRGDNLSASNLNSYDVGASIAGDEEVEKC
jgi:hypothetical protein